MGYRQSAAFLFCFILASTSMLAYGESNDSILSLQRTEGSRLTKARRATDSYLTEVQSKVQAGNVEQLTYGKFIILLNQLSNGNWELQVYRIVTYGDRQIKSMFSSQYQASIEYGYTLDPKTQQITQHHYLFPPNSLTGWANPSDAAFMKRFPWKEKFPSQNCSATFFTLEEYGREYLEATCFPDRDTALRFATKFANYVSGARGM